MTLQNMILQYSDWGLIHKTAKKKCRFENDKIAC